MKARIRRKIVKQFCKEFGLSEDRVNEWLHYSVPKSARYLRRHLENILDNEMEFHFGKYCR